MVLEHRCHPEEADLFDLFGDLSVLVVDRSLDVGDGQRQGHLTAVAPTTTWVLRPGLARIHAVMSSHDDDATGPTDTITSPGSRPAAAAGVADVPDGHCPDGRASPAGSATVERARHHGIDRRRRSGNPDTDEHYAEQQERQDQVHHRPAEHDDHALADGKFVEQAVLVSHAHLFEGLLAGLGDHRREPSGVHGASGAFGVFFARGSIPIIRM